MKYFFIFLFIISGCSSMPLQGLSDANYSYRPPIIYTSTTEINSNSGNCQPSNQVNQSNQSRNQNENLDRSLRNNCYSGRSSNYISRRTSTYTQPENAFESTKESFRNFNSISRDIEQIYNRVK